MSDDALLAAGAAAVVGLVATVILASMGVLDNPDAEVMGVCANAYGDRVEDSGCGENWDENGNAISALPGNYFMWIDTSVYSGQVPPVGQRVTVGQRTIPFGKAAAKGVPAAGGNAAAIKRGGFGASAGKVGGSSS